MDRNIYIADEIVGLAEYIGALDDLDRYNCWQDEKTQEGYNHKPTKTFEEFANGYIKSRWIATIVRNGDSTPVGSIFLSPENTLPDLAIMIYEPHRGKGFGTRAFSLGVRYCFDTLGLETIYAGSYQLLGG